MKDDSHSEDAQVVALAEEILGYLKQHPNAADTGEHIGRWWILRQRIEQALADTQQALDYLERQGAVEKTGQGRSAVYRLATMTPRTER